MPRVKSSRNSPSKSPAPQGRAGVVRIISGQWKGRKLPVRDVDGLRPTTDRVKETIFNWLAPHVRGARCLDLFAGSGGLGLEALSRYAEKVTLVEMDKGAADQLRKNLAALGSQQGEVIQADAVSWLQGPATPFDLVFLDPPFRRELLPQVCELLEQVLLGKVDGVELNIAPDEPVRLLDLAKLDSPRAAKRLVERLNPQLSSL